MLPRLVTRTWLVRNALMLVLVRAAVSEDKDEKPYVPFSTGPCVSTRNIARDAFIMDMVTFERDHVGSLEFRRQFLPQTEATPT